MRSLIVLLGLSIFRSLECRLLSVPNQCLDFCRKVKPSSARIENCLQKAGTQLQHRLVLITVPGNKRDRFARLIHWWMEPFSNDAGHYLQ